MIADFVTAAFPYIVMGVGVAIAIAYYSKHPTDKKEMDND